MVGEGKIGNGINKVAVAIAALVTYNILLTAVVGYGAYYGWSRLDSLSKQLNEYQSTQSQVTYKTVAISCRPQFLQISVCFKLRV